jgi:hypothetical protein
LFFSLALFCVPVVFHLSNLFVDLKTNKQTNKQKQKKKEPSLKLSFEKYLFLAELDCN